MAPGKSDERERMVSGAAALGIALGDAQATQLERLLDELERWNRAYNLTSIRERDAMVIRHVLDSLSIAELLRGDEIVDVGTGAGFPGLPLAILNPHRRFTLVDANQKKIRFVTHAVRVLGLTNVTPLQARAESLKGGQLPADTIVARAFAPLERMLKQLESLAGAHTRVVAMKASLDPAELAGAGDGWVVEEVRRLNVPGLEEARCAVIARRGAIP